jgi:hypothetical protein
MTANGASKDTNEAIRREGGDDVFDRAADVQAVSRHPILKLLEI